MAAGFLIASSLATSLGTVGGGAGLLLLQLLLAAVGIVVVTLVRRRRAARAEPARGMPAPPSPAVDAPPRATTAAPEGASVLDDGLRDIRRTDPKFDPTRFTGYIETVFRNTQTARMSRNLASLRDRVTPELYGELEAQCERSRSLGQSSHVDEIDVRAQVTEAWQEDARDYVTAYVVGTMLDYTVDETTGALVAGSRTVPEAVEAFWTFTRPAGLNPWMLSAIQTA